MVALKEHVDAKGLKRLIMEADLTLIGTLQAGLPGLQYDNVPKSLLDDPPHLFEHGG